MKDESTTEISIPPVKLEWNVDPEVEKMILKAENDAGALIHDTHSVLLQTEVYGGRFIKEVGMIVFKLKLSAKSSPDAYIQMALQIAWKRSHHVPTAVYETASTRAFSHGRTETVRSLTSETWKMAEAFDDSNILVI
jgi:carnitine O-acetyltransferase